MIIFSEGIKINNVHQVVLKHYLIDIEEWLKNAIAGVAHRCVKQNMSDYLKLSDDAISGSVSEIKATLNRKPKPESLYPMMQFTGTVTVLKDGYQLTSEEYENMQMFFESPEKELLFMFQEKIKACVDHMLEEHKDHVLKHYTSKKEAIRGIVASEGYKNRVQREDVKLPPGMPEKNVPIRHFKQKKAL